MNTAFYGLIMSGNRSSAPCRRKYSAESDKEEKRLWCKEQKQKNEAKAHTLALGAYDETPGSLKKRILAAACGSLSGKHPQEFLPNYKQVEIEDTTIQEAQSHATALGGYAKQSLSENVGYALSHSRSLTFLKELNSRIAAIENKVCFYTDELNDVLENLALHMDEERVKEYECECGDTLSFPIRIGSNLYAVEGWESPRRVLDPAYHMGLGYIRPMKL